MIRRVEKRLSHISFLPVDNGEGLQILHYVVSSSAGVFTTSGTAFGQWFRSTPFTTQLVRLGCCCMSQLAMHNTASGYTFLLVALTWWC